MKMALETKDILGFYSAHFSLGSSNIETRIVESLQKLQVWNELTDEQKQKERKKYIAYFRNKLGFEKENRYEERVAELVDCILEFVRATEAMFSDAELLKDLRHDQLIFFRLRNMLLCEKEAILRLPKLKNVGHVPAEIITLLLEKTKGTEYYKQYQLHDLEKIYLDVVDMRAKSPYT
jgi:hypothetical protein